MKRNYGLDMLKIISMFMIVILHILGCGGVLNACKPLSLDYEVMWLLEIMAYCAVNCYGLISGYVNYDKDVKYTGFITLWLQVALYSVGLTLLLNFLYPDAVNMSHFVNSIFPVMSKQYWYFSAYACLFVFIPLLNTAIKQLPKEKMYYVLLGMFILFSIAPLVTKRDALITLGGYSTIWVMFLYIFGACMKKYNLFNSLTIKQCIMGYSCSIFITWLVKLVLEVYAPSGIISPRIFVNYVSPTMVASAVFLLILFMKVKYTDKQTQIIKHIVPLTFSVYLIHTHPLVFNIVLKDLFTFVLDYSLPISVLLVLIGALLIFVICVIIDYVRAFLFTTLKIKKVIYKSEEYIISKLIKTH